MNTVLLTGNLATDVELKDVGDDRKVANFLLAVDRPAADGQADFIRIACWNRQAEVCDQFLARGKRVAVGGRLRSRSWEDTEGQRKTALEVVASQVEFLSPRESTAAAAAVPFEAVAA